MFVTQVEMVRKREPREKNYHADHEAPSPHESHEVFPNNANTLKYRAFTNKVHKQSKQKSPRSK